MLIGVGELPGIPSSRDFHTSPLAGMHRSTSQERIVTSTPSVPSSSWNLNGNRGDERRGGPQALTRKWSEGDGSWKTSSIITPTRKEMPLVGGGFEKSPISAV